MMMSVFHSLRWVRRRIAHRFALWSAGITLLVALLLGLLSFQATTLLLENNLQRTTEYHLKFLSNNMKNQLEEILHFTRSLAGNSVSSNALADSEGRQAYLNPFFRDASIPQSIPFNLHLCDFKGRPLVSKHPGMLTDIPYDQWATQVVEQGKPMAGYSQPRQWLAVAYPVIYRATGLPEGMMVVEFDFAALMRKVTQVLETGTHSKSWFSALSPPPEDEDGGPDREWKLQQSVPLPAPISALGLNMAIHQESTTLRERMNLLLVHYVLILVGTMILTVVLTLLLVQRLLRPLGVLTRVAGEIADEGTPNRYAPIEDREDELGELARSFNRMVERLHSSQSDLELRVEDRTRDLQRMQKAAEAANQAKSEFLSIVTHEIRTPLNVIIGLGDQLAEAPLEKEQRHHLEILRKAGDMLLTLVNDVLELARVESGGPSLSHTPFHLEEVVHGALELIAIRAREKGIRVSSWVHADIPCHLIGDDKRLRQVLLNLLGNALKFTEKGWIRLQVRGMEKKETSQRIQFELQDTGIGIPEDKLNSIFDPFTQVDPSTSRRYAGSGLGLAITRRFVQQMGGELRVESTLGQGSRFQFDIEFNLQPPAPPKESPLPGLKVTLLVGDVFHREILLDQLPQWGCHLNTMPSEPCDVRITDAPFLPHAPEPTPVLRILSEPVHQTPPFNESFLLPPWSRNLLLNAIRTLVMGGPPTPASSQPHPPPSTPRFANSRILLVEDAEDNILLMEAFLRGTGCSLVKAYHGQQAVEIFDREGFDLILMDIQMPVMDGMEATRRIRALERERGTPAVPIIALTAFAWAEEGGACVKVGCTGHLAKPVRKAQIFEMLRTYLVETSP